MPTPKSVETIELGPAERVDAIVTMDHPGVFTFGEIDDKMRNAGLGVVVEYADRSGQPQWSPPGPWRWDYTQFGSTGESACCRFDDSHGFQAEVRG